MSHLLRSFLVRSAVLSVAAAALLVPSSAQTAQTSAAPSSAVPAAPGAASPNSTDPFPQPNLKFFDASTPTLKTVEAFLNATWGYDPNRIWKVEGIQKTEAPGVAKVTVFVADKREGSKVDSMHFFVTPDGKYAIADSVFHFGDHPFADTRALLQAKADGPAVGSSSKQLMLVEFADMQCPHCKEAQETVASLHRDFPNARIVFQNFPLTQIHPFAYKAALDGNCVDKAKGDAAFFLYLDDIFAHQEALTPEMGDTTIANAITASGADAKAVAACVKDPASKAKLDAQIKLGDDLGVDQTPMISINGRLIPLGGVPYEMLKQIVTYDAQREGAGVAAR